MDDEQFDRYLHGQRRNFWAMVAFAVVVLISNSFVFYAIMTH